MGNFGLFNGTNKNAESLDFCNGRRINAASFLSVPFNSPTPFIDNIQSSENGRVNSGSGGSRKSRFLGSLGVRGVRRGVSLAKILPNLA